MKKLLSFTEELLTAPWWDSLIVWGIGNTFIWLIIPGYLAIKGSGGAADGMQMGGYEAAQPLISRMFNIGMTVFVAVSVGYNLMLRKRRSL